MQQNKMISVVVVVLVILVGIVSVVTSFFAVNSLNIPLVFAEKTEKKDIKVAQAVNLNVENTYGNVDIVAKENSDIKIEAHYKSYGLTQDIALKNMEKVELEITQNGPNVSVKPIYPSFSYSGLDRNYLTVDLTLVVPVETSTQVFLEHGGLTLKGTRGDTDLSNEHGSIYVSDIGGGFFAAVSSHGSIRVEKVNVGDAPITIENQSGSIDFSSSTGGEIDITSKHGSIELNKVDTKKTMNIRSESGSVIFGKGETGALSITSEHGRIDISDLKVNGDLVLKGNHGQIDVNNVKANAYKINAEGGTIHASGVRGEVAVTSGNGSIEIKNGEGAILSLETRSGHIQYSGSLGEGTHQIFSEHGSIDLNIPADTKADVLLKTEHGSIRTDFDVAVQGELDENTLSGKINGGGGLLKVTSESGAIILN